MPQAVTHVLIALIIASLIRDFFFSRKNFPLHYVLIAGVAGLLPDLDIIVFWFLYFFGFILNEVHRTFTHTLFLPLLFLLLSFDTFKFKNKQLGKHHLKLDMIFLMLALGSLIHLILDASLNGIIMPFYPLSSFSLGFNIASYLPQPLAGIFFPSLDAILLVLWLIYMELRHKISNFV